MQHSLFSYGFKKIVVIIEKVPVVPFIRKLGSCNPAWASSQHFISAEFEFGSGLYVGKSILSIPVVMHQPLLFGHFGMISFDRMELRQIRIE